MVTWIQRARSTLVSPSRLPNGAKIQVSGTGMGLTGADGGEYLRVFNGDVQVNSAILTMASGGVSRGRFQATSDGAWNLRASSGAADTASLEVNNITTATNWIAGQSGGEMYFGTSGLDSRVRSNMATPGTLANGDWWVDSDTGAITGASGALKARLNGATVFVAPAVRRVGRATAQTAAVASVAAYTVPAADGSFEVSANVLVTTATTHAFNIECAYTDEGNTARVLTMTFGLVAGGVTTTSIANANGAVPYMGVPLHIRAKASTTITIRTQAAGTYTTVTYNVEGIIKQTA